MDLTTAQMGHTAVADISMNQGDDWLDRIVLFDDQQIITIGGSPSGGTFRLNFRGYWTGAINFAASAAAVQTALQALPTVRSGKATATGSAGGPFTIAFDDDEQLAGLIPLIVGDGSLLTPSGSVEVDWKPIDLTGYTARLMIRELVTDADPVLSLTTANGKLIITPSAGEIAFNVAASETSSYTWRNGAYDLEMVSLAGVVEKVLRGNFELVPEVTR